MATTSGSRFIVDGIGEVLVKRRRGQRTSTLRVGRGGQVVVATNYSTPLYLLQKFVSDNAEWIKDSASKHGVDGGEIVLVDGQRLCDGVVFRFQVVSNLSLDSTRFKLNKKKAQIEVLVESGSDSYSLEDESLKLSASEREQLELVVIKALRWKAKDILAKNLESHADMMGVRYSGVSIRNTSSRWGSCSGDNRINLSLWLMILPKRLVDYVTVHELAHVKFKHHGPEFWAEVAKFCPKYKEFRKELKSYSSQVWW